MNLETTEKMLYVKGQTDTRVGLFWSYCRNVNNYLKKALVKNEDYYWEMFNGEWTCWVNYEILNDLSDVFIENGFNVDVLECLTSREYMSKKKRLMFAETKNVELRPYFLYLYWNYDRATKYITDNLKPFRNLSMWIRDKKNNYWLRVRRIIIKDLVPLFYQEGYDVEELKRIGDNYVPCSADGLIEEEYQQWKQIVKKKQDERFNRTHLSTILSSNDLSSMEKGEYQMIDLSRTHLKFVPYDFQIDDIKTLLEHKRFLNANEMGTGKTFESVVVGESIPKMKLVVCPASLRLNWEREIKNVNPNSDVQILYSKDEYHYSDKWTIIGYNSLQKHKANLLKTDFGVVFFDEAHFIQATSKGYAASKRARAALDLAKNIEYVYPITGTPKTNRNKNLYNILNLLKHPITFGGQDAYVAYAERYCGGCYTKGFSDNMSSHDKELHQRLSPWMIRHLRSEVLPHLTKQRIIIDAKVNLSEYEKAMLNYREIKCDPSLTGKEKYSASLGELQKARVILAKEKVSTTIDLAKDFVASEESVVIVTCFKSVVDAVEKKFGNKCVKIVGGMSDKQKQEAIDKFQNGDVPVLVMNVIAGGVGVTLTKAHIAIINDYEYTVGNMIQAEDRICRSGQKQHCLIYYISAIGSILDESFMSMIDEKSKSINDVVDGGKGEKIDFIGMVNKKLGLETDEDEDWDFDRDIDG